MAADHKRESELAIERLKVRQERVERKMRGELRSADFEDDSAVIEQEAHSRHAEKGGSVPAPARGLKAILELLPPWGRVVVLLALFVLVAALAIGGALEAVKGWF